MTNRERRRAPPRLSAGELAHLLLRVCELGVPVRERAACLGVGLARRLVVGLAGGGRYRRRGGVANEIRIAVAGPRSAFGAARELREGVRHARSGHDDGCLAFGVSLSELRLLAERWAAPDAAGFALEVLVDAAGVLAAGAAAPDELHASPETREPRLETLHSAVRARLTPVMPPAEAIAALGRDRPARADRPALLKAEAGKTPRGLWRSAPQPPQLRVVR
ncbi:hypothetical protein [Leucobacter komagatae]|uniref:hypothetical protein n=1 Tax=Leucobacter komagatae TaxID=55969 RepID=UPI00114D8245|nr:hypothetical protein [Leucobacter komagatae]